MADSRKELLLMKLNGEDVQLEPPQSRIEKLYYKLLGADIVTEPPQSREEVLLKEYIDNGGGGGGGGLSTYTITLICAPNPNFPDIPVSAIYFVNCFDENYTLGGAIMDNGEYLPDCQVEVFSSASQDIEVMLFPSKGISVSGNNGGQPLSVTGDAEIVHHEDWGYWDVYVTGNCTITYQESK